MSQPVEAQPVQARAVQVSGVGARPGAARHVAAASHRDPRRRLLNDGDARLQNLGGLADHRVSRTNGQVRNGQVRNGRAITLRGGTKPKDPDSAYLAMLDEVARELRGGHALRSALVDAIDRTGSLLPADALLAGERLRTGEVIGEVLEDLSLRSKNPSVAGLRVLVAIGDSLGGVTPKAVDALARSLRDATAVQQTIRIAGAQANLSGGILAAAPLLFCAGLLASGGRAATFLVHHPLGRISAGVGLVADLLGLLWMRRLVARALRGSR